MHFSENVLSVASEEAARYGDDIEKAVEKAYQRVRKLDEYADLVNDLVRHAVQNLVYQARHSNNRLLRNQTGDYHPDTRVNGMSNGVLEVYASYYTKCVAGRTLGNILGSELDDLVTKEASIAKGHTFNAELFKRLRPLVADDKRVNEAVPEKKLKKVWQEVQRAVEWAPVPPTTPAPSAVGSRAGVGAAS